MRHFFRLMVLPVALLLLTAAAASADPLFGEKLCPLRETLTASQQALYEELYDALAAGEDEIGFDEPVDYDDVEPVVTVLSLDTPELCALGTSWSVMYVRTRPEQATGVSFERTLSEDAEQELLSAARELAYGLPDDPFDRLDALHERLCERVVYDGSGSSPHSAWGALVEGRAVCEGYAKAFALLCRLADIPCSVVEGDARTDDGAWAGHSWCLAVADGTAVLIDPTWDDQDGLMLTDWLCLSDEQFAATHRRTGSGLLLPTCEDSGHDWHTRHGLLFMSAQDAWDRCAAMADGEVLRLRFPDAAEQEAFLAKLREGAPRSCRYFAGTGQPCVTILTE